VNVPAILLRRGAGAVLLLSAGVVIGTYARRPAPLPQGAARVAAAPASPVRGGALRDTAERTLPAGRSPAEDGLPPAPGFDSALLATPASAFGGGYTVLRGAETVPAGVAHASPPPPPVAAAPVEVMVPDSAAAAGAQRTPPAEPEPFRPSPARGIPAGLALRYPLLAVARAGGRVAFHDLGIRGGVMPAGIEGEWAVVGRCETFVRIDFALPTRSSGEFRAIGRASGDAAWSVEPVVARQACAAASAHFTRPHVPTEAERAGAAAAAKSAGMEARDLVQAAALGSASLLVFHRTGLGTAVVAVRAGAEPTSVWTQPGGDADGGPWLIGVYRMGSGATAWLAFGERSAPTSLLIVSSPDLRGWTATEPSSLRQP
jgi:hypothetical protein